MITTRIATLLLLAAGLVSARQQTTAASPALDRVLQDRIHKLLDSKSESDQRAALDRLRAEVRDPAELRPLLWAWHQVTGLQWERRFGYVSDEALARGEPREPRAQLAMLAAHPRWWARAFAARVAREEPLLLGDARASDLVSDPHPLVRELAGQALQQAR